MISHQRSAFSVQRVRRGVLYSLLIAHCSLFFAGCVPADLPPQLNATPGAFVRVDGDRYDAGVFSVAYPSGWRIVKNSIASAPMQVVFVAPDDSMTITVSEIPLTDPEMAEFRLTRSDEIAMANGTLVYVQGAYPVDRGAEFENAWVKVIDSIV